MTGKPLTIPDCPDWPALSVDKTRQDKTRPDKTREDKTRQDLTLLDRFLLILDRPDMPLDSAHAVFSPLPDFFTKIPLPLPDLPLE